MTSSATSGNQWYKDGNILSTETGVTYSATIAGSYTVTATTSGCTSVQSGAKVVTVNAIPVIGGVVATNTTSCGSSTGSIKLTGLSSSVQYSVSYTKGTTTTLNLTSDASGNVIIPNLPAGSYTGITVSVSGCSSSASTASISDPGSPTAPVISAGTAITFCSGGSVVLTSSAASGNQWYKDGSILNGETGVTYTATTSGSYTVTTTSGGCTSAQSTAKTVTVIDNPSAPFISVTQPTCTVSTATLTVTSSTSGLSFSKDGVDYSNTTGVFANIAAASSYSITAKNSSGCISPSATGTVNTQPATPSVPVVSVTQPTCTVSTATLTVTSSTSGLSFSKDGVDYSNTTGVFANIAAATSYSITAKNSSGCISPSATGTVNTQPATPSAPVINVTQPTCTVSTATLTVTSSTSGLSFSKDGVDYSNTTGVFTNIAAASSYSITAKNVSGCISPSATGTINTQPVVPVAPIVSSLTYCKNATASALSAIGSNLNWYTSLTGTGTTIAPVPSTTSVGTVTYYVTQSNECGESPKASLTVTVSELQAPVNLQESEITNNTAILSWDAVSGAVSYTVQYKETGSSIWMTSTVNNTSTNLTGLNRATTYIWKVSANCSGSLTGAYSSEAQFATASYIINNIKNGLGIMVYPNPAINTSKIAYIIPATDICTIVLYNSIGQKVRVVLSQNQQPGQYEIPMADILKTISNGIYILEIRQGVFTNYTKFIKP